MRNNKSFSREVVLCQDAVYMEALDRNVSNMAPFRAKKVGVRHTTLVYCRRIDKTNVECFRSGGRMSLRRTKN